MATPTATCPDCSGDARYIRSIHQHHGSCTHYFWCDTCDQSVTTTITDATAARKEFFGDDAEKSERQKSLDKIVGDASSDLN